MSAIEAHVVVVGSVNLDLVVQVPHHVRGGETLLGGELVRHAGGKGANQAVGAARAGGVPTQFIGAVGADDAAEFLLSSLTDGGVDTTLVQRAAGSSGTALISVDPAGENAIIVAPGANGKVTINPAAIQAIAAATVLLAQLEIPLEVVLAAAQARSPRAPFLLNAAPSAPLPPELLAQVDVLIVNEHEAADLVAGSGTGISIGTASPTDLAQALQAQVPVVVVTLGAKGALIADAAGVHPIPAFAVAPVDTTGAGDTFCGVFAAELAARLASGAQQQSATPSRIPTTDQLLQAGRVASAAGALATTVAGAQTGVPAASAVRDFLNQ